MKQDIHKLAAWLEKVCQEGEAAVFDNSTAKGHIRVAEKDVEGITIFEPVPEWAAFLRG